MYLVTGATGNVGRHVVEQLLAEGAQVRATSRRPASAALPSHVEVIASADGKLPLERVTGIFLNATSLGLFAEHASAGDHLTALLDHARTVGVCRVVMLSSSAVLDADNPVGQHHRELEQRVELSGLAWTILRPGMFSANALAWASQVRAEGVVRAPYGAARLAPIDERDIASVATRALLATGPDLRGAAPVLSGPEVLTQVDQVRVIGAAIGVPLRFQEVSPEVLRRAIVEAGEPSWAADGLLRYFARAVDQPVEISPEVMTITGRSPRSFADWVASHLTAFQR